MRKYIFISLFLTFALTVMAQTPVSAQEKTAMLSKINKAVAEMSTLQCEFKQTKKLSLLKDVAVSKGRMAYKQGGKLRWEYTSPTNYIFVLNNENITIKAAGKTSNIDIKKNKVFKEVVRIMMSSITGQCLTDTKTFTTKLYKKNGVYIADLTPQKKEMKQMFKTIRLTFCKAQNMVEKVEMIENKGDITTIELLSPTTNKPIDDKLFAVK